MANDDHDRRRTVGVSAAAAYVGVPEDTLWGWLKRGVVPSFKIGGRRMIDLNDVDTLIDESKRLANNQ